MHTGYQLELGIGEERILSVKQSFPWESAILICRTTCVMKGGST